MTYDERRPISILDKNTANQIAAGEVVERPASVVKELIENSLDAAAAHIAVKIYGGGIDYIQVRDDGWGMTKEQAALSVLRHATSKLRSVAELLSLGTLGFRGEALPSIASVSRFTLLTRPEGQETATSLTIEGGGEPVVEEAGGPVGTGVMVEDLFYNVPARRKFLRSQATEGRYIGDLVTKLALSRPDVSFQLTVNDRESLRTPGNGDVAAAIRAVYGAKTVAELLPVNYEDERVKIEGFVSKPTLLKSSRQWQTFLVNGRLIQSPMLSKAMDHAYQSQVPKNGFPFAVLRLSVDPAAVDVNVHPQKAEVKFSEDNKIYTAMYKALIAALTSPLAAAKPQNKNNAWESLASGPRPSCKEAAAAGTAAAASAPPLQGRLAAAENREERPAPRGGQSIAQQWGAGLKPPFTNIGQIFKTPEPLPEESAPLNESSSMSEGRKGYEEIAASPLLAEEEIAPLYEGEKAAPVAAAERYAAAGEKAEVSCRLGKESGEVLLWPIGQVDKTFIIAQSSDSLFLIDQHAAHERILYDKLVIEHREVPAQQLLLPQYMDIDDEDGELLEEHKELFAALGVELDLSGAASLCLRSLPADISPEEAGDYIKEIIALLRENKARPLDASVLRQKALHMTACRAAIKAGQELTLEQMRRLIIDLCNSTHPFTCPHGRPCMIEITSKELYKMFKRTGF